MEVENPNSGEKMDVDTNNADTAIINDLYAQPDINEELIAADKAMNVEVVQADSVEELKKILKAWPGVVVDFWASWSAPAISFRDVF